MIEIINIISLHYNFVGFIFITESKVDLLHALYQFNSLLWYWSQTTEQEVF